MDVKHDNLSPHKKPMPSKNRTLNHMNPGYPQNKTLKDI